MIEFEEVKVPQYENRYTPKSEITEKKTRYNCKLKGCLKETIEKIDNLEEKVHNILFLDNKNPQRVIQQFLILFYFL